MPKFTSAERTLLKSIVATLSIKRIPESEIIKEIFDQTNKTYDLQYLGIIGNTFHTQDIDRAIKLGKKYKTVNKFAQKSMGIDPDSVYLPSVLSSFSSSVVC